VVLEATPPAMRFDSLVAAAVVVVVVAVIVIVDDGASVAGTGSDDADDADAADGNEAKVSAEMRRARSCAAEAE
jgi:hypothetical protein